MSNYLMIGERISKTNIESLDLTRKETFFKALTWKYDYIYLVLSVWLGQDIISITPAVNLSISLLKYKYEIISIPLGAP